MCFLNEYEWNWQGPRRFLLASMLVIIAVYKYTETFSEFALCLRRSDKI